MNKSLGTEISRRAFVAAGTLAGAAGLAGCSSSSSDAGSDAGSASTAESSSGDVVVNACLVTADNVDDGSFTESCYEGLLAFQEEHDDCATSYVECEDYSESIPTVEDLVGDYDSFILTGYNFAACGDVAEANPDVNFILIDSTATDSDGNAVTLDNVWTGTYCEEQGGIFAGVAAAMESATGKVAIINGIAYPSNINFQYGFESGVYYANAHYGTSAEIVEIASYAGEDEDGNNVGGNYTGDFNDMSIGKTVAESLIADGVDVIFCCAGQAGLGAFTAIKETEGVYAIGVDVDQYDDGVNGDENIILTSVTKNLGGYVQTELNAIYDGTFEGGDATLSMSSDPVGLGYVSEEGRQQLSDETLAALEEVEAGLIDGTIVPASSSNGYAPDDFPGLE